jgi:hypothetical protein
MCNKCLEYNSQLRPSGRRFAAAYLEMAKYYRPVAPSDGFGHIEPTKRQVKTKHRLQLEAFEYALKTQDNDSKLEHFLWGCTSYSTNKAFVFLKEAAEFLFGGSDGAQCALKLIKLAERDLIQTLNTRNSSRVP